MAFNFKTQLRTGDIGEALFYQAHGGTLAKEDGRKNDFKCLVTDGFVELKTDSYSMAKTLNFFFERYSDKEKGTPGGPWQALANGNEWFCYFYVSDLTYFKFKTSELVAALEEVIPLIEPKDIPNKTWTTQGYAVPRAVMAPLYKEYRIAATIVPAGGVA